MARRPDWPASRWACWWSRATATSVSSCWPSARSRRSSASGPATCPSTCGPPCAPRWGNADPLELAGRALERADRLGVRIVTPEDDEWPHQLLDLRRISRPVADPIQRNTYPPHCIWVRGPWPLAAGVRALGRGRRRPGQHRVRRARRRRARLRSGRPGLDRGLRWRVRHRRGRPPGGPGRRRLHHRRARLRHRPAVPGQPRGTLRPDRRAAAWSQRVAARRRPAPAAASSSATGSSPRPRAAP